MREADLVAEFDYILVGGGLQSCLCALALFASHPSVRIALVEANARLAGNHTWSFHSTDLQGFARMGFDPCITRKWPAYRIVFPNLSRTIDLGYESAHSVGVERVVLNAFENRPESKLILGTPATELLTDRVRLADGQFLKGKCVVDSRGMDKGAPLQNAGFQKFVGLECLIERSPADPSELLPTVMDATVEQVDGFRFVYVLPFENNRVLLEDTYYSDSPALDHDLVRDRIIGYAKDRKWAIKEIVREEAGVLPIPWREQDVGDSSPLRGGYRGGWFHYTTGYSVPVAARLANLLAESPVGSIDQQRLKKLQREIRRQNQFCRLLNWMLFHAFEPEQRWNVLERFYQLPTDSIARFYRLEMKLSDRARLLSGRPPRGFSLFKLLSGSGKKA